MKQYLAFGFSATQKYVREGSENAILNVWEPLQTKVSHFKKPSVAWAHFTGSLLHMRNYDAYDGSM